jgi:diguanylate cyclase (GGDEF)-like protein
VYVDANWVCQYCNDVYLTNVGLSRQEVIGRTPFQFLRGFRRSIFYEAIEKCRQTRSPMLRIGFSTALNRWLMVRVFPMGSGMVMLANDASEAMVKQHQLAQKAVLDPLTGLGNKLAMEQLVEHLHAQGQVFSIIVLGIHRFKDVNDTHGYAFGDMVLLELASALQSATTAGETLFRLSGDEFAVVCAGEPEGAAVRAATFMKTIEMPIVLSGARIVLHSCAGTVRSPDDGTDYELLLKRAALALRDAKRRGKESIGSYRTDLEVASRMRAQLEAELRVALEGHQFVLHFQPRVSLTSGAVVGAEALIRWAHPKRGLLAPGTFLSIAEEIGMMAALDQWVLRASLKAGAQMRELGVRVPLSINVSVDSLSDMYMAERVSNALRDAATPADLLEVEIPEGTLMHDVQASARVLSELHAMGVRISIDDFGTGYSSFAYLAQFPVHSLKIDRSFVKEIATSETSRRIVRGVVRLAHSLSLDVVAEGAEHDEQVAILRRMKCDCLQGYVIAKPLPLDDFVAFARSSTGIEVPSAMTI